MLAILVLKWTKTYLLVKEEHLEEAPVSFELTDVFITSDGLGCPIGTFIAGQVSFKINIWNTELSTLSDIAKIHPKLAYSAIICGVLNCPMWRLETLKDNIQSRLILFLCGKDALTHIDADLLLLSIQLEGMCLIDRFHSSVFQYRSSLQVTLPLMNQFFIKMRIFQLIFWYKQQYLEKELKKCITSRVHPSCLWHSYLIVNNWRTLPMKVELLPGYQ